MTQEKLPHRKELCLQSGAFPCGSALLYYMRSEFSDYMLIKREESDIIKSECVRIPLNILDRI